MITVMNNLIVNIIEWVEKNINIDETILVNIEDIRPSKIHKIKKVSEKSVLTPLIISSDYKLLDGHNRLKKHLELGNTQIEVIKIPELGDKILYLDLIIFQINQMLFEKRVKKNFEKL